MQSLLIESAVRTTLLIAAVALVLWALRIKTAYVRHAVWASVVGGMLLLPALVAWGPQVSLALLPEQAPRFGSSPIILETGGDASPVTARASATAVLAVATRWSWQDYALGVYLLGLGLFLTRLAVGTLQVHRLLNSAELDHGKLVHKACSTPITVGCFRPTVLLPSDWREWPEAQLAAVLAHEAEHVRRRDPLFQWLALSNRAIFWFHPLAWWLEKRLSGLAEEVCDAAVLAQGHDPADYSRYLLAMARSAQESGARVQALGLAMPGVGLRDRIRNIMNGMRSARVSRTRLTCIAILISGAGAALTTGTLAHAQQPLPKFEVATVKPAAPADPGAPFGGHFMSITPTGEFLVRRFTLQDLIKYAYGDNELPMSGGPKWMNSMAESFDIEAKGPANAPLADLRLMVRELLAVRFKLKTHTESKEIPAYALAPARNDRKLGSNLVSVTGKECEVPPPVQLGPTAPRCGGGISVRGINIKGATMQHLAAVLSNSRANLGRPVIDRTGITGEFNFNLEFPFLPANYTGAPAPAEAADGPSVFTAIQEQLGLKLENARASVDVLVVDSAEKPGEN